VRLSDSCTVEQALQLARRHAQLLVLVSDAPELLCAADLQTVHASAHVAVVRL